MILVWGVTPEDPERNNVLRLEGTDNDFVDPERNDILQLEGMDNDFGYPERNDILRLGEMRRESGLLILINNGFTLFMFVIFYYLI